MTDLVTKSTTLSSGQGVVWQMRTLFAEASPLSIRSFAFLLRLRSHGCLRPYFRYPQTTNNSPVTISRIPVPTSLSSSSRAKPLAATTRRMPRPHIATPNQPRVPILGIFFSEMVLVAGGSRSIISSGIFRTILPVIISEMTAAIIAADQLTRSCCSWISEFSSEKSAKPVAARNRTIVGPTSPKSGIQNIIGRQIQALRLLVVAHFQNSVKSANNAATTINATTKKASVSKRLGFLSLSAIFL